MRINLNTKLVGLDHKPFYPNPSKPDELTLKEAIKIAAVSDTAEDKLSPGQKFDNYMLAKNVTEAGDFVDITAEQMSWLKKSGAKRFNTEVYGSFCLSLENIAVAPVEQIEQQ